MRRRSANHGTINGRLRLSSGLVAATLSCIAASTPAAAQSGEIVVLREVDARNAITPGTGDPLIVKTTPDSAIFSIITGSLTPLDDQQAAMISSGKPGATIQGGLLRTDIAGNLGALGHSGLAHNERGSAAPGGGTISGAINLGMGALQSALVIPRPTPGGGQ